MVLECTWALILALVGGDVLGGVGNVVGFQIRETGNSYLGSLRRNLTDFALNTIIQYRYSIQALLTLALPRVSAHILCRHSRL